MKRLFKRPLIVLVIICLLPLVALLERGLPLTHDGVIHVARIANFYQNLSEGIIVPRWAANLNWGFGTPILMFVYPLSSYIASIFHMVGISLVDSTKLVFALSYIASAVAMYVWIKTLWGKGPAFVTSILYAFVPYRFVDLYVRGALGEHVAFIFPPLMCFALVKLTIASKRSWWYMSLLSLTTAGLILAHNALSVMFLPIVVFYGVYLFVFENKNKLFVIQGLLGLFYGFLLSAFFWIPGVLEQKYTLINKITAGNEEGRFTSWLSFIYSPWSYGGSTMLSKQLGPISLVVVGASFWFFAKLKNQSQRWFIAGSLLVLAASLFLMTKQSSFIWESSPLLEKFQFPWRFLSATTFIIAVLGGLVVSILPKRAYIIVIVLTIVAILYTVPEWHPKGYIQEPEKYYTGVFNHTTDSGETSPIWSVRFMLVAAKAPLEVIDGHVQWNEISRTSTRHVYVVTAETKSQLLENTLYFPGWEVRVDGRQVGVEFQNPTHRGLMTFMVDKGEHTVDVRFGDTKLRKYANILSLISWSVMGFWLIIRKLVV